MQLVELVMEDRQFVDLVRQLRSAPGASLVPCADIVSRLQHRIASLGRQREALADVVDRLGIGVILAESSGGVVWANRAAAEIAARTFADGNLARGVLALALIH